jgi:hypothetical protein
MSLARPPEEGRTAGRQAGGFLLRPARPPEEGRTAGRQAGGFQ